MSPRSSSLADDSAGEDEGRQENDRRDQGRAHDHRVRTQEDILNSLGPRRIVGRVNDDPAAGPDPCDSDPLDSGPSDKPFPGPTVAGGVLGSVFFPVISLIAALSSWAARPNPVRREALRRWAILSGGLIAAQVLLVVIAFASVASVFNNTDFDRNKECNGGPVMGASASRTRTATWSSRATTAAPSR